MKKLKGLKNNISSFENNRLNELSKVNGGLVQEATVQLEVLTDCCGDGSNRSDKITKHDSGRTSTLIVG